MLHAMFIKLVMQMLSKLLLYQMPYGIVVQSNPDNEKTAREIKTHGRIIDDYNLFFRNCVTTTIKLIEESRTNVFNDWELDPISPHSLFIQLDMKSQVKK